MIFYTSMSSKSTPLTKTKNLIDFAIRYNIENAWSLTTHLLHQNIDFISILHVKFLGSLGFM